MFKNSKKPVVIKFQAKWCHFCKDFEPDYKEVAKKYSNIAIFADLDIDIKDLKPFAKNNKIDSIPVIMIFESPKKALSRIDGGNRSQLEKDLEKLKKSTTQKKEENTVTQENKSEVVVEAKPCVEETTTSDVISIKSKAQLDELFKNNKKPVAIKFHAKWCHFCKDFESDYKEVAKKYSNIAIFADLDIDKKDLKPFAKSNKIDSIPVIMIFSSPKKVLSRIDGGNRSQLEKDLERLKKKTKPQSHKKANQKIKVQ